MRVRSLNCPSCGGVSRIQHGQQEAVCEHCGQPVRLSQAVLQEQERARAFPTGTPVRLGMKAQWEGREYEVTGRQVLRAQEEGEIYQWEEWILIAPDGDVAYLEFDEGKWKLSRPFVPETPVGPQFLGAAGVGDTMSLDGSRVMITDSGLSVVAHVEGEFPWLTYQGKNVRYVDAGFGNQFCSVEWTEDEIEYYRGRYLDQRQVFSVLNLHEELAALDRREAALRSRRSFGGICVAAGVAALILWVVALGGGRPVAGGSGTILANQAVGEEGVRYPVRLTAVGRVHRIEVRGSMREQSVWLGAVLEDADSGELVSVDRDMWDESGTDSDGYWHESDLHASTDFVLRKPGDYYVRLYAEPEPGRSLGSDVTASFSIKEGVLYPVYPALLGFGLVIAGTGFLLAASPGTRARIQSALESDDD